MASTINTVQPVYNKSCPIRSTNHSPNRLLHPKAHSMAILPSRPRAKLLPSNLNQPSLPALVNIRNTIHPTNTETVTRTTMLEVHTVSNLEACRSRKALLVCNNELLVDLMEHRMMLFPNILRARHSKPSLAMLLLQPANLRRAVTRLQTPLLRLSSSNLSLQPKANINLKVRLAGINMAVTHTCQAHITPHM